MDTSHKMTEQILNLTLEILYLLTGQDYTVMKKCGGCLDPRTDPMVSGGWVEIRSSTMVPPCSSLMHKRSNEQKILEITSKIIQLLTGEVPIRCQDVTVHLSMEEWEYLEGHKDQYKDVMMEDHQPLTPPDGSSNSPSPESSPHPLYSVERLRENPNVLQDQQNDDPIVIKVEETNEDEEYYRTDPPCEEGETPTSISTDVPLNLGFNPLPWSSDCEANFNITGSIYGQHFITIGIPPFIHSGDLSPVPATFIQPSSDQPQILRLLPRPDGEKRKDNGKNEGRFPCAECGKSFELKSNLIQHLRIHTVEKPHCNLCGKYFKRKSYLARHYKTHTGEKPFLCSECGKRFTIKSSLLAHHRIHTGERPFPCPVCGKCFIQKSDLVVHQIAHAGEKPFVCTVCGKCFNWRRSLVRHKRIHTGEKS